MLKRSTLLLLLGTLSAGMLSAQTVQWAVRPTSAQIENYGSLLKVKKGGKCGLVNLNEQEIVPVAYDSISPFRDGYALVMNKAGNQLRIEGLLSEGDNEMLVPTETVYATRYMWFSDGKMPVKGAGGWGYLGTDGNMAIPCQFQFAYPFSEGYASVMLNDKAYYINRFMDYLPVEAGYGNLVFASTFSGQEAVVYSGDSYTPKGYVINRKGRILRQYKVKPADLKINKDDHSVGDKSQLYRQQVQQASIDNSYEVYQEDGLYGYKKNGAVVLPAQLDKAEPVRGEYANVQYKGQNGVLQFMEGSFSHQLESSKMEVVGKEVDKGFLQLNLPESYDDAAVRLRMVDNQGREMAVVANSTQGTHRSFSFLPATVPTKSENVSYQLELWSGNLLIWKDRGEVSYNVIKPVAVGETVKVTAAHTKSSPSAAESKMKIASFALSRPEAPSKRAGVNNTFYVTVTVSNSGDKTGVASVSLVVDGKNVGTQRVNVRGRSNAKTTFAAATNVKKERYAKVRATLSDGKSSQEVTIPIIPFY